MPKPEPTRKIPVETIGVYSAILGKVLRELCSNPEYIRGARRPTLEDVRRNTRNFVELALRPENPMPLSEQASEELVRLHLELDAVLALDPKVVLPFPLN